MTAAIAVVLILLVAGFVVLPLLSGDREQVPEAVSPSNELWRREKAVAVMAIAEADFDRATGKLSDDDYRVLRSDYEGRALQAMDQMRETSPDPIEQHAASEPLARFCGACGTRFGESDAFCGGCGRARRHA